MVIGITGGVGSGKSTVLHLLSEKFGCFVIEADEIGHQVMQRGGCAYEEVVAAFGSDILKDDFEIDRKKLAEIVFHDKAQLEVLNHIVHPAVKSEIKKEIEKKKRHHKEAVIVIEAALLIEAHYQDLCDELWYIYATEQVRFLRLQQSRGYTVEKTKSVMANQLSEAEFLKHCNRKIDNSYDVQYTYEQIKKIFEWYFSEEKHG